MAREPSLERKKKGRIQATRDATAGLSTWALRPIPRYYCRSYEPIKRLLSTRSRPYMLALYNPAHTIFRTSTCPTLGGLSDACKFTRSIQVDGNNRCRVLLQVFDGAGDIG